MRRLSLLGLATLGVLSCAPAPPPQAGNLILISIDTLRPDMLGAYGYARPTSPTLDALAASGTLFETAVSPAPWTMPAHASLLTGVYPKRHGMKSHDHALAPETTTLAERLGGAGFTTAAIVNSHLLSERFGMHRGFQEHTYQMEAERRRKPSDVVRLGLEWLERKPRERFFLFLHFYDLHSDYRSLPRYEIEFLRPYSGQVDGTTHQLRLFREGRLALDAQDARNLEDRYVAGIRQLDDELAELLAALERTGTLDDSLLVVTSDHGEEFLSHGGVMHGRTQYDDVLRVPLIMAGPGIPAGRRIAASVSLLDLVPTLLSLLGLSPADGVDGVDLSPLLRGERPPEQGRRRLFGEADWGNAERDVTRSLRVGSHKAILDRTSGALELYDLAADPGEQRPLEQPELAQRLRAEIEAFAADEVPPDPSRALPPLNPDDVERLRALGYL